ncbi:MAG: ATP-binding cassette domain-containing protein, partial [Phycisphaerales bacterium]
ELEAHPDAHRRAEIHERLSPIDAQSAPARAATSLSGLGCSTVQQDGPCSALSGGWRMRVALAAALFSDPDLLLLDEPTVGLDLPARAALLGAIDVLRQNHPGIAVVMSTHLMTDAERFEHVVMLSNGAVAAEGSPGELVQRLGDLLIAVPAGVEVGNQIPCESQADGSAIARPQDEAQLSAWTTLLAEAGVPFSVRRPTLADAYLHLARAPLQGEAAA